MVSSTFSCTGVILPPDAVTRFIGLIYRLDTLLFYYSFKKTGEVLWFSAILEPTGTSRLEDIEVRQVRLDIQQE